MVATENKVVFGLSNLHYAIVTEGVGGKLEYGTPKRIPGVVELTLDPRGELYEFFADNRVHYAQSVSQGYEGSLTIANIPEEFAVEVLGEEKDETDGVISEKTNAKGKTVAFLFEFDGDQKAVRHALYNCTVNRPTVASKTTEESMEVQPNELTFNASGRPGDYLVKNRTSASTTPAVYDAWYNKVYEKAPAA